MLFKPSYAIPFSTPIDATLSNTFSCYLNAEGGTQITKYNFTVQDLNGTSIYNTGDVTLSPVLYNENTLSIIVPNTSGMVNGIDYVWNVLLYESNPNMWVTYGTVQSTSTTTNIYMRVHYNVVAGMYLKIGNETRQIQTYSSSTGLAVVSVAFTSAPSVGTQYNVYTNNVRSEDTYFKARKTPVISITNYTATVTNKSFTFTGSYTQDDGVDWKYYTFNLYDAYNELVYTTREVNTGVITLTFDGFVNNTGYQVELIVETQDGVIVTTGKQAFTVTYAESTIFNNPVTVINVDGKNALNISWGQPLINEVTVSGTVSPYLDYSSDTPTTGQTSVNLYEGTTLSYTIGTTLSTLIMPYESTMTLRTRLPVGFVGNIVRMQSSVDGSYYTLSYNDGTFSFSINNLYNGTIKIQEPSSTWLLGSSYDAYTHYIWDDTQTWDDTKFFYEQTSDILNEHWCEFVLLPTAVFLTLIPVSDFNSPVDYTPTITLNPSGTEPSGYDTVLVYGQQTCDYIWICDKVFNSTEIAATKPITFEPTWDINTMFLALYNNKLDAGSIATLEEDILQWSIYRRKSAESVLYLVDTVDVTTTHITDYNVANQTDYVYLIFPITATAIGSVLTSVATTACWWNWSLTGIIPSDTEGLYYADTENIWLFTGNIASGATEQNIDKTVYQGFTKYAKVSVGVRNYLSGSLGSLIGSVVNSQYTTETVERQKNLLDFIQSSREKILKDPKGNIYWVDTTRNAFNILDASSHQPVSISFEWVEIGDMTEISVVEY